MKKLIALLMVATMTLSLCACGGTEYTEADVYGKWVWDSSKDSESISVPYVGAAVAFLEEGACLQAQAQADGTSNTYAGEWTLEKNLIEVKWTYLIEGDDPSYDDPSNGGKYKYSPLVQKFKIVDSGVLKSGELTWIFDSP